MMLMSSSVCSARSTIPSPVTALQSVSENHAGIDDTLSMNTTHDAAAIAAHERISLGGVRTAAGDESTSDMTRRPAVVLAVPCSPTTARIGCGMPGNRAETSHATVSRNRASSTLSSSASGARLPPRTSTGSGPVSGVRRNKHRRPLDHPPAVAVDDDAASIQARQVEDHRARAAVGDPECDGLAVGTLRPTLKHGEGVGERRPARRLVMDVEVEARQLRPQPVLAPEARTTAGPSCSATYSRPSSPWTSR